MHQAQRQRKTRVRDLVEFQRLQRAAFGKQEQELKKVMVQCRKLEEWALVT